VPTPIDESFSATNIIDVKALRLFGSVLAACFLSIADCDAQTATASPAAPTPAPSSTPSVEIYGKYPTNYKEIITDWLEFKLVSADTARIQWLSEPYPVDLSAGKGRRVQGYRVDFSVDAKNLFGAYTGRQKHGAIVRNGEVIQGIGLGY
jgi:hypothetical protein